MLLITNYEGRCGAPLSAKLLQQKTNGLDAIVEGIKLVEKNSDIHTVGLASWPNILGELQLDASVMDGTNRRTGAVGGIRGFLHPVAIAHKIMTEIEHEILVGEGAERFAREIGALENKNETEFSLSAWHKHLATILTPKELSKFPELRLLGLTKTAVDPEKMFDTTVYLSLDHENRISTATSTSGWAWKYPGRLGDSPIIGAGSYADSRYGACACTHTGEMTIRAGTARSLVLYLKMGLSLEDAVYETARDLADLKTGYLAEVTIHAIDKNGDYLVVGVNSSEAIQYLVWHDGLTLPEVKSAQILKL